MSNTKISQSILDLLVLAAWLGGRVSNESSTRTIDGRSVRARSFSAAVKAGLLQHMQGSNYELTAAGRKAVGQ